MPPASFIDISLSELSSSKSSIINNNSELFKRLGRITNIVRKVSSKSSVKIVVNGETIILYFDQNLDLNEQKKRIDNKAQNIDNKIRQIHSKLKNKSFLKNAPKQIVEKEKKALLDYKIELKKLNSIINSIKN